MKSIFCMNNLTTSIIYTKYIMFILTHILSIFVCQHYFPFLAFCSLCCCCCCCCCFSIFIGSFCLNFVFCLFLFSFLSVLIIFSWSCCSILLKSELVMMSDFYPRRFVTLTNLRPFKQKLLATALFIFSSPLSTSPQCQRVQKRLAENPKHSPNRKVFQFSYFSCTC